MNNKRRDKIRESITVIECAMDDLNSVADDERDAIYSVPENLQNSIRYSDMEDAVDFLEDAMDDLSNAITNLNKII